MTQPWTNENCKSIDKPLEGHEFGYFLNKVIALTLFTETARPKLSRLKDHLGTFFLSVFDTESLKRPSGSRHCVVKIKNI